MYLNATFLQRLLLDFKAYTLTVIWFLLVLLGTTQVCSAQSVNNKLYGGIEIGSKGIKATVVELVEDEEDGYDVRIVSADTINAGIMVGVEKTGKFSPQAIEETAAVVKKFYGEMIEKSHVPEENIYIIGSSGLEPAKNKDELGAKVSSLTGKTMAFITVATEVHMSISGLIPERYSKVSLLMDIGSGNTKGGYRVRQNSNETKNDVFTTISIPKGTVTFTDAISKESGANHTDFVKQADSLANDLITLPLRKQIKEQPEFLNRQRVYLAGGITWAMATLLHPDKRKSLVRIEPTDINKFYELAVNNPTALLNPDLSKIFVSKTPASLKAKQEAEQDLQKVRDTFTPKNLVAGAKILKSLSTELNFQQKRIYFARQGYIAWLFSYVADKALKTTDHKLDSNTPSQQASKKPLGGSKKTAPTNNKLYGGIEIGSKGVKATVVEPVDEEDGYDAKIISADTINTGIMVGVEKTGKFSPQAIEETAAVVKKFYGEMVEKSIPEENIYIVGSSGLEPAKNKDELGAKVSSLTGKTMAFITVATEVHFSISGLIPERYNNTSLLFDVGSGNTKGGYRERRTPEERKGRRLEKVVDPNIEDTFVTIGIPKGTVTLTDAISKESGNDYTDFVKQADNLANDLVTLPLRGEIERKPGFENRQRVYLTGGITWAMATLLHPDKRKSLVRIEPTDINKFYELAVNNPTVLLNPDLSKIFVSKTPANLKAKQEAEQDLQKVRDTFTPKNLVAGAKILKSLSGELNFQQKRIYFARQGYIAWLFSYIANKAKTEQ